MKDDVLVKVESISKRYSKSLKRSLWYGLKDIHRDIIGGSREDVGLRKGEFWALQNINFELKRGECIGLIGHNGAGKSTLLKLLNGLIPPDKGKITMKGRVGALIELTAGFNPILSGRENIFINGAILGFSKKEIKMKLDSIIEFSEIEDFLDMPVQNYSSGMKVRLGFAVASQMEPDVLLIDEVLAVGDAGFRIKCFNAISEISKNSAVIFVSHVMPQVARVSTKLLLLDHGKEMFLGDDIAYGIEKYYDAFESERSVVVEDKISLLPIVIHSSSNLVDRIRTGDNMIVKIPFSTKIDLHLLKITLVILDKDVRQIATCDSKMIKVEKKGNHEVILHISQLFLLTGSYTLTLFFYNYDIEGIREIVGYYRAIKEFKAFSEEPNEQYAPFLINGEWKANSNQLAIIDKDDEN